VNSLGPLRKYEYRRSAPRGVRGQLGMFFNSLMIMAVAFGIVYLVESFFEDRPGYAQSMMRTVDGLQERIDGFWHLLQRTLTGASSDLSGPAKALRKNSRPSTAAPLS